MGIQSAMFSGVSGLNTNSQAMSVIGNNLANTNTLGFKGSRTVFSDLLSSNIFGSGGSSQVGRGVGLSTVDSIFSQGTFETTSSDTDVAIEGDSFFVVSELGVENQLYTRAGAFSFDEDGYLVNPEGYVVQGKQFQADGTLDGGDPGDIQVISTGLIEAQATTELTFETNLDASADEIVGGIAINPDDNDTYNYSASSTIYDSLGEQHLISAYWQLEETATNTWNMAYTVDGEDLTAIGDQLIFDGIGQIDDPLTVAIAVPPDGDWDNGAELAQEINLVFDCTQFDSDSAVIGQNQDGYGAGELTKVGIGDDGIVIASYSNGEQVNIAQLVLAKFQNTGGLELAGSNLLSATDSAGTIRIGLAGAELGSIFTNSLEQSNVDMGQEFVKMITTQRGFQANSKIISTVDEMLSELINLKR